MQGSDLWREIVWCSAKCPCRVWTVLCKAKVGDFDVTIKIKKDVFRLEIPIDDIKGMQMIESQRHLSGIKLGDRIWESLRAMVSIKRTLMGIAII